MPEALLPALAAAARTTWRSAVGMVWACSDQAACSARCLIRAAEALHDPDIDAGQRRDRSRASRP